MKKTTKTTGTGNTEATKKKRIFYPGNIYVVDKNNIVFASAKCKEDLEGRRYEDDDTVLISIPVSQFFKHVSKVESITIDFKSSVLTVKGSNVKLSKTEYDEGDTILDTEELKEWQSILADAYKVCNNVIVLGTPPIEGTPLDDA